MQTNPSSLIEWAISYANRGWPILPLMAGTKVPACRHGVYDATTEIQRISRWWNRHEHDNIGIATGHAFDVFDVDIAQGVGDPQCGVYASCGPTVDTPGGGYHVYLQPGHQGRIRFAPGVDWKGLGGYVVAPPSWSSERGRGWTWHNGPDTAIGEVPAVLRDVLTQAGQEAVPGGRTSPREISNPTRYGEGALLSAEKRIREAEYGQRNTTLNYETFCLTRLVAEGHVSEDDVIERLAYAAQEAGLPYSEVLATIRSAFRGSPWL